MSPIIVSDPVAPSTSLGITSPATDYLYLPGSGIEIPGVEAVLEYGDASAYKHGGIPGALRLNDRSMPDQVRVTELSGLQDDPDVSDSRTERAGNFGERAGILLPRGRTVGITGHVRAGNVGRMRDLWRRTRAQFNRTERDLIVHPPGEAPFYVNEVWSGSTTSWAGTMPGATVPVMTVFTDGTLIGLQQTATGAPASVNALAIQFDPIAWAGEDLWMTAIVRGPTAAAVPTSIALSATFTNPTAASWLATTTGIISAPATGGYYLLVARMIASSISAHGSAFIAPRIVMTTPATAGSYTLRAACISAILLDSDEVSPSGYLGGGMPGYEWEGPSAKSRSYGPCYAVNQVHDPDSSSTNLWTNDSTGGTAEDVAGVVSKAWPADGRTSILWTIRNPNTTPRTLAIKSPATLADPNLYIVAKGRSYRAHLRLLVRESFAAGIASIVWLNESLAGISTSTIGVFDAVASGGVAVDVDLDAILVAPLSAVRACMTIVCPSSSTTSGNKLSVQIAEPRFIDVSEFDSGSAIVDGSQILEHGIIQQSPALDGGVFTATPIGARRRIPRPFLVRGARALWDGKAPESQRNLLARRDFTMSLRASDPRIYTLEERRAQVRASGVPKLVSAPMSSFGALLSGTPSLVQNDYFTGISNGSLLNGRTAELGGTWATSGSTTDFAGEVAGADGRLLRSTISDLSSRRAVLGATSYASSQTDLAIARSALNSGGNLYQGVVVRYVDASNYVLVVAERADAGASYILSATTFVATVPASVVTAAIPPASWSLTDFSILSVEAYASGRLVVYLLTLSGSTIVAMEGYSAALATGGALASGKSGIQDSNGGGVVVSRRYDAFTVKTIPFDIAGAPTGFTFDGASIALKTSWRPSSPSNGAYPRSAVAIGPSPVGSGFLPAASIARMYRSQEAYTYTTPQVTVAGDCIGKPTGSFNLFTDSYIGGAWQYNYIGALVKRVSATTWLELRYNSANSVVMAAAHPSPAPPSSMELWCSHTTAGTLTTTRLDAWDVSTGSILSGAIKFVRSYMAADGKVYMELWGGSDPNLADTGLISRRSYVPSAALLTLLGPSVAGQAGALVRLGRWDDGTGAGRDIASLSANYDYPYIASFESLDYVASNLWISCPVIGDIDDVPWKLRLQGNIDSPIITTTSFGEITRTSTLRLSGVFTDADPVTVDFDAGTIQSESGANYFSARQVGSKFNNLSAGQNFILITALGWDSAASAHAIASWRDALT